MVEVHGKNGVYCRVIADSVSPEGKRMSTMEMQFHRWILAEVNTHRSISKNLQSSRAVPLNRAADLVDENPAHPVHWGAKEPGMMARAELQGDALQGAQELWETLINGAIDGARQFDELGAHKQWAARILEPYMMVKAIKSGTNWDNLLWLRDDEEAQPEYQELAACIRQCLEQSVPEKLNPGEWHVPYVETRRVMVDNGLWTREYLDANGDQISLELALKISASCTAQISYRRLDDSVAKAIAVYDRLFSGRKPHMSPVEHQATPIPFETEAFVPRVWPIGITHVTRDGTLCSGNLEGFIQYRQTLPNNCFRK